MKAYYFDGNKGENVREEEIPAEYKAEAEAGRHEMLESLAMFSDEMMELLLSGQEVPKQLIHDVTKSAAQSLSLTPVFMAPLSRTRVFNFCWMLFSAICHRQLNVRFRHVGYSNPDEIIPLSADPEKPFVGMAFKIVDDPFGQLTFMRIYQGRAAKGETYVNQRTGRKERFSRIVRMHADKREEIDSAEAGDIVAIMGIDSASGDTYGAESKMCTLESMFVPAPVIKMAISAQTELHPTSWVRLSNASARRSNVPSLQ